MDRQCQEGEQLISTSIAPSGKVALIARPGGPQTGIGRYVQKLHEGLGTAGVRTTRVAPVLPSLPKASYQMLRLMGRDLRAFLTNYPTWSRYPQADVYHLTEQGLASLLLLARPKGTVVVTVHDIFPYMYRNDPSLRSYYAPDRVYVHLAMAGLRRANLLIADSEYTKQCIVEHLHISPERIKVVYLGIDRNAFRPMDVPATLRDCYRLPATRPYLIYVGTEDPRKNLITLVRALAEIRRQVPDVELIKVGRSHFPFERERLCKSATELGVRDAIHFLEDVPESDLPLLYNLADVFVSPSLYEGFGLPALEAMACGTPVVCSNAGALGEVVADGGLQVETREVTTLAGTLVALLQDRDRQSLLRHRGQERAAKFTWTATVRSTVAVYERLLQTGTDAHRYETVRRNSRA